MNKKIAFYIPLLNIGGAERVVLDLLREFAVKGEFDVYIITDIENSVLANQIPKAIKLIHLQCGGVVNRLLKIVRLRTLLREHKFDFVISNLTHANIHIIMAKVLFHIKNTKLVLVEHSVASQYINQIDGAVKRVLLWILTWLFYRRCDKLVCVSGNVKDDLVKHFHIPESQCEVIYNPIDVNKILAMKTEAIDPYVIEFIKNKKVLISVGRLERQKNHKLLLQAFSLLGRSEFVLLIVGDGTLRKELEEFVRENHLADSVKFMGFQTNPYKYIKAANLLVLPSMFEGFGLVLVEAMLLGKQVVAVQSETIIEIIKLMGNGYLSNSNPHDLAEQILLASSQNNQDDNYVESVTAKFAANSVYSLYREMLIKLA